MFVGLLKVILLKETQNIQQKPERASSMKCLRRWEQTLNILWRKKPRSRGLQWLAQGHDPITASELSQKPEVSLLSRASSSSLQAGPERRSAAEGCELVPTAAVSSPILWFSESRAHKPRLYWRFRATKPALFNTGFSYLGWRINSTIIKSIKYIKLDFFFRDGSKHKLVIKRFSERLEIVFAVLKFPWTLRTPCSPSSTSWILKAERRVLL